MDINHIMPVVKKCKLFSGLDESQLDTLVFLAYTKQFSEGDAIYTKGQASNNRFCMIISGGANIVSRDGDIVKVVGIGQVIGEIALSDPNRKRTVTVTAAGSTEVLEWDINHIKEEELPGVRKKLVKLAWEHMREYYEDIE